MHTHHMGRGTYQGPVDGCPWCDEISRLGQPVAPQPVEAPAPVDADRLLKDALFASIEPTHRSPLYCGVAVTAMTQACAAVFYVPRDWSRDQIKAWLGNPQGFAAPPVSAGTVKGLDDAARALLDLLSEARGDEEVDCSTQAGGWLCGDVMSERIEAVQAALPPTPAPTAMGWERIGNAPPPKDVPFLARNPGFAAFIAEWSDTDQAYLHFDSADGWCALAFSHWSAIPPLPAAPVKGGAL